MSKPVWHKKLACPFCGGEFETARLRQGALRVREKWSDFGCLYEGPSAYFYAVTACPRCLVAARNEEFEKLRPDYEPKLMEFSRRASAQAAKPDLFRLDDERPETAVKRHELAIACHRLRKHGEAGELAGLWLHVAWIWRQQGQAEPERKALEQALASYQLFYEKSDKLPERLGEPGVLYLIGELQRRLGLFGEARSWFTKALAHRELRAFPNIEVLLREQMLTAKQQQEDAGLPG